jgi:hypothetical protein
MTTDAFWTLVANSEPLVTIHPDKTMTFGKDYTPDAAARLFWDAVLQAAPTKTDDFYFRECRRLDKECRTLAARVAELEAELRLFGWRAKS